VSGYVFGASTTNESGARALKNAVKGAVVTWECPSGGPDPQKVTSDVEGWFESRDFYRDIPADCALVVEKTGYIRYRESISKLCDAPAADGSCRNVRVAIELVTGPAAIVARPAIAVPLDLPKDAGEAPTVFSVTLLADGRTMIGDKEVPADEILVQARAAHEQNPEVRAVIKADSAVPHGRVIHVLDLLKQAQISKIAFGVSPVPPQ
jgi:biopolymer transport protein ExbD